MRVNINQQVNVRGTLRRATSDTHEEMHRLGPFRLIESGELHQEAYVDLLTDLFRYHALIAAGARQHGLNMLSSGARKLQLLRTDLASFSHRSVQLPRKVDIPSACHALGALYVAEGSMFGGKVIARQLDYLFEDQVKGRSFFLGAPEDTRQWKSLVAVLETYAGDREAIAAMIGGAELAFRLFERCVTRRTQGRGGFQALTSQDIAAPVQNFHP